MGFLAFFIFLIILILIFTRLKLSLMLLLSFEEKGFHMEARAMFYRLLTLYRWNLKEGGVSFLLKKKKDVPDNAKKKKGRLNAIIDMIFSKDTFDHVKKNLEVFDLSVKGRLATEDASLTALIYGGLWSIIGVLIPIIPQKRLILEFYPDFKKVIPDFHVSCILRVRIIHIIVLIIEQKRKKMREGRSENYGTASY